MHHILYDLLASTEPTLQGEQLMTQANGQTGDGRAELSQAAADLNLMEFWKKLFSSRIYDVDYDLLTVNQEDETRKLIHYLGLSWEEKCLSPQENKRSVSTASNMQVRKKVYQNSSQQWKKYRPFLNGALDYLDNSIEQ